MKDELVELVKKHNNQERGLLITIDLEQYVEKLYENATIFSISENGVKAFIAFYCNDKDKNIAFLSLILVDEELQGSNLGSFLLKNSIELIKAKGFKYYHLEVLKTNIKAIKFYTNFNFIVFEENNLFFKMKKCL